MSRWTQNQAEAAHLSKLVHGMPSVGILRVHFTNGTAVVGLLRSSNVQNNAGAGGAWHFRSGITLETVDRVTHDIDLLDVSSIDGAWDEFKDEFQRLGLITIVSLPGQD